MAPIKREKLSATLEELEMDILVGVYRPRERLVESDIMQKHGITRNAVRNIFKELQIKGLVRHLPNRGVTVAEMEAKEAYELYSMRVLLENYAADLIIKRIDDESLAGIVVAGVEFERSVERKSFKDMVRTNIEFHQAIVNVCAHSILIETINQLRNRAIVVRHYIWLNPEEVQKSIRDHHALVEALGKRNASEFRKLNQAHILAAYEKYTGKEYSSQ